MKSKKHAKIALDLADEYGFDAVLIVTIDRDRKLQISGGNRLPTDHRLVIEMMKLISKTLIRMFRGGDEVTIH